MPDEQPGSVLIIQTAFIGDALLVIPLLEVVKTLWPHSEVDIIVRPPADNLLETHPAINNVILYDKYGKDRGLINFLSLTTRLRKRKYDLALLPHRSLRSGLIAYLAKIPSRHGFARGGGRFFHTRRIIYPRNKHEIERNLTLLSPFASNLAGQKPVVYTIESDVSAVNKVMQDQANRRLLAFAPGSVWYTKRWPMGHYIKLAKICIKSQYSLLLIGGDEDFSLCHRIAEEAGGHCKNLAGKLTLRQSVELLKRCILLVTNDSAPTHLGTAAGIPVITLFGSTSPQFGFAPYGLKGKSLEIDLYCRTCTDHGRKKCPEKHLRCLNEITPERVFREMQIMLNERPDSVQS